MKRFLKILCLVAIIFFIPFFVNAKENKVKIYLFHGDGCPHCAKEIEYLKEVKKDYKNVEIVKYEVWYNEENSELLEKVKKSFKMEKSGVPTTVIGDVTMIGFGDSTPDIIEKAIKYYSKNAYVDQIEKIKDGTFSYDSLDTELKFLQDDDKDKKETKLNVPIFGEINLQKVSLTSAAVIIGLVDGFNPCAMWVLLFLISVLLGMKDRKRMWILGLTFLFTSALVYLLIMLSWITIAVKMTTVTFIKYIIALIALGGGIFNLYSFITTRNDSGCTVVDDKKRKKIFSKIKKFTREKNFFIALGGVIGLAISVNLVELACSAGLPLVFSELLAINDTSSFMKFMYTLLYILFFLIDDLIIFFIAMFTTKVTGISTKYNKYSHLIGGIIMVIIGILLLFKPEWLMFQFK